MVGRDESRTDRLVPGLALLAIVQLMVLLLVRGGPRSDSPEVSEGYDFGSVEVLDGDSTARNLARGEPTLVLVFHSECPHCAAVAPDWADWLGRPRPDVSVIAVSREPYAEALAYAEAHAWDVNVGSVVMPLIGAPARTLVRLTPWVYGLDGAGVVVAAGHGSELGSVATQLLENAGP